ncbi:MAG: hypothetical protein WCI38_04260 [Chthoniobacterales bacterium]|jgi:hypothetical protein
MTPDKESRQQSPLSNSVIIIVLLATSVLAGFAITSQSYWIDEASSLVVSMATSPADAWKYAQAGGGAAIQMPIYHAYLYAWHKAFGSSEWAMRSSNIPLLVLGQLAFLVLLRQRPKFAVTACLLVLISPAVWMYVDEARPYLLQYSAACWLAAAVVRLGLPGEEADLSKVEIFSLVIATTVLLGSSLLGMLWGAAFATALLWLWRQKSEAKGRPTRLYMGLLAGPLLVLCLYYAWSWAEEGGGSYRPGSVWAGVPYVIYEFLGFAGFGPGRLALRTSPLASIAHHAPSLIPLGIVMAALGIFALLHLRRNPLCRKDMVAWGAAFILPSLAVVVALWVADYQPLPRYFMPLLPAVILAMAAILPAAITQKYFVWRAAAVLLPLLWLYSSLNLRWREEHAKDDYRTAATIAAAALRDNKEVWWAADAAAGFLYLPPVALENVPGRVWAMQGPQWDDIRFKFPPRVIVMSKPDIFDPSGAVARYAAENHFVPALRLHAFTILTRENDPLPAVSP